MGVAGAAYGPPAIDGPPAREVPPGEEPPQSADEPPREPLFESRIRAGAAGEDRRARPPRGPPGERVGRRARSRSGAELARGRSC